jgi:ubiquinol-cytochrome c reductase cytochrome b/c1 subunit
MLRSIPSKSLGVVVLLFSILVLLIFPIFFNYKNIFSNKPVTAVTYTEKFPPKGSHTFYSFLFWCFVVICVFLGILGGKPMDFPYLVFGRLFTFAYFSYFVIIILYHNKVFSEYINSIFSIFFKKK